MKYDIHVNQRAIIEGGFDLDIIEAAIIDHCRSFSASQSCQFKIDGGTRYYWFSHKNVCEQLPILRLKPDSVYRRMKGICEKGFMDAHPDNKKTNSSWYCFLPLADKLVGTIGSKSEPSENYPNPTDENPIPIGKLSVGPSDENPMYNNNKVKEYNKQQPEVAGAVAADTDFEIAKRKINDARAGVLNATILKEQECMNLKIPVAIYDRLVNGFFDEQLALAEAKEEISFSGLRKHLKNWLAIQVRRGTDSRYHPQYNPHKPVDSIYPSRSPKNGTQFTPSNIVFNELT